MDAPTFPLAAVGKMIANNDCRSSLALDTFRLC
jgi:hypothetical protein